MARKSTWLPGDSGASRRRLSGDREPGADHDYMAREYLTGPSVTPLGEVFSAAALFAGAIATVLFFLAVSDGRIVTGALLVTIGTMLVFVAGGVFVLQRGIRRWRWRMTHIERTGGVYLKPWQRTPDAYRGGSAR